MTSWPRSVLVVVGEPDGREETATLGAVGAEVARRGIEVHTWALREGSAGRDGGIVEVDRVVDDLRTWAPAARLEALGLRVVADALRGRELRRWAAAASPDVVWLDGGLGRRLLRSIPGQPVVLARATREPSPGAVLEPAPDLLADLVVAPDAPDAVAPPGGPDLVLPELVDVEAEVAAAASARPALRAGLGIGPDVPLVAGWGQDGWLDGPDLFVRHLWHLAEREGVEAHGVWFGLVDDVDSAADLLDEAERCGVGARFHLLPWAPAAERSCADAVFLPHRAVSDRRELLGAAVVAPLVVAETAVTEAPWAVTVPPLDLDAAAAATARVLRAEDPCGPHRRRHSVRRWVDGVLERLRELDHR